jgi:receptor protein-tyrosine kinase
MTQTTAHLVERAAERLRHASGLLGDPPPMRGGGEALGPERGAGGGGIGGGAIGGVPSNDTSMSAPADSATRPGGTAPLPVMLANGPDRIEAATAESDGQRHLDISTLERAGLVVGRKSRTRISEEFRIAVGHVLRTLQSSYSAGHGSANLVLVTSSRPGEGKSFTALNLAGCIAQQNQREVILVDIDAKQRPVTYELGLGDAPGLLDLVRDPTLRLEDVVVPTSIPALSFVPIGARLASNGEMPLSRPISAVVERLGRRFANRVIILDAPPCLSTSDPSALAPIVGQIVMVVEAERTQRNELVAALELVNVCPTITLLLNKIQLTTSYTFGAYHYFGTYS